MAERAEGVTKVALRPGVSARGRAAGGGPGPPGGRARRGWTGDARDACAAEVEAPRPRPGGPPGRATWSAADAPAVHGRDRPAGARRAHRRCRAPTPTASASARARGGGRGPAARGRRRGGAAGRGAGHAPRLRRAQGRSSRSRPITGSVLFAHHAAKIAALRARYGDAAALVRADLAAERRRHPRGLRRRRPLRPGARLGALRRAGHPARGGPRDRRHPAARRPDRIALSPDGHGGLLSALRALRRARRDGRRGRAARSSRSRSTTRCCRSCRPELLGHHALAGADMSSVVVRKVGPEEKMGVIARVDGRTTVVEYSDLPDELAQRERRRRRARLLGGLDRRPLHRGRLRAAAHRGRPAAALPPGAEEGAPRRRRGPARGARRAERGQVRDLPLRRAALRRHAPSRWRPRARRSSRRSRTPRAPTRPRRPGAT